MSHAPSGNLAIPGLARLILLMCGLCMATRLLRQCLIGHVCKCSLMWSHFTALLGKNKKLARLKNRWIAQAIQTKPQINKKTKTKKTANFFLPGSEGKVRLNLQPSSALHCVWPPRWRARLAPPGPWACSYQLRVVLWWCSALDMLYEQAEISTSSGPLPPQPGQMACV